MKTPVNVAITGAAGQIGYALAFRVASGQMLGPDQPALCYALRGLVYTQIEVTGPTRDLHSGEFGGAVFGDLEQALGLIEEAGILERNAHGGGERFQQANI